MATFNKYIYYNFILCYKHLHAKVDFNFISCPPNILSVYNREQWYSKCILLLFIKLKSL